MVTVLSSASKAIRTKNFAFVFLFMLNVQVPSARCEAVRTLKVSSLS